LFIQLSTWQNQPVFVDVCGRRVTLTVRGRLYRGQRAGLTEEDLAFARNLD
jgi:hypothetical protein